MAGLAAGGQQATPSQQAGAAAAGAAGRAVGGGLRGELAVTSAERFSAAAAGDAGLGLILVDTEVSREGGRGSSTGWRMLVFVAVWRCGGVEWIWAGNAGWVVGDGALDESRAV